MNKETFKVTEKEFWTIQSGDNLAYEVIKEEMIEHNRWSITYRLITKRISDGKFFRSYYDRAATESQEDYAEGKFEEVFPKQVEITIYE